ncbi:adenosylcobinamide-GDP ribazoletransferase [bacterium D16-51]|nr:adenosylcobinamide-GDP ribazoletransferase [bacterium D16-59]RKI58911.1 adenosylcobinamide-GDP ribazoletransferase [bacterium D16-51]
MLKSLIIAFSTYSRIPMPKIEWEKKSMKYSMCFFPLVGAVIGLFSMAVFAGMEKIHAGKILTASVMAALPVLLTGGIHFDGFLDTVDAKSSYQPVEEKLRILKDPHTGAFAIIYGIVIFLLSFGLFSEVHLKILPLIALGYVYSRILSGLSVTVLKKAKKEGMAASSAEAAGKPVKWILLAELAFCMAGYIVFNPFLGTCCILAGTACFFYYKNMAYRIFGGITGDLAGYFLQVCELSILVVVVVGNLMF